MNLKIPEQLSIVGFDNILLTQSVTPNLTTVRQHPYETGCPVNVTIAEQ